MSQQPLPNEVPKTQESLLNRIADCLEKVEAGEWVPIIALDEIARLLESDKWTWERKREPGWMDRRRDY